MNKTKDSLKLMSVSYFTQTISFVIFQVIYGVIGAIIVCVPFFIYGQAFFDSTANILKPLLKGAPIESLVTGKDLEEVLEYQPIYKAFLISIIVFLNYLLNIPFGSALSTFFSDVQVSE